MKTLQQGNHPISEPTEGSSATAPFITFYSFKGGVGRSMALINTASILAGTRGFRVLVIDLDLEAPGLSYLNTDAPDAPTSTERPATPPHIGFVDLITDAKTRGEGADLFCLKPGELADRYTRRVCIPSSNSRFSDGTLHIMPAGLLDEGYTRRLDELDLNGLYRDGIGEPLMRAFKQRIGRCGLYDYVLVDSRTGISEGAGICTRDLADHVMVLSGLNRQNVEGTSKFLTEFAAATQGSKTVQIILSPIPNGEDDLLEQRRSEAQRKFEEALGQPLDLSLEIPYHPQLVLTEEPHIFRSKRGYLFEAYTKMELSMLKAMGQTSLSLELQIMASLKAQQFAKGLAELGILLRLPAGPNAILSLVGRLLPRQPAELPANLSPSHTFDQLSASPFGPMFLSQVVESIPSFSDTVRVSQLLNALLEPLPDLAKRLIDRVALESAHDSDRLALYALTCSSAGQADWAEHLFLQAIHSDPSNSFAATSYGWFLGELGRHEEADLLFRSRCQAAPHDLTAHFCYGLILAKEGRLDEAKKQYEWALELDPEHSDSRANLTQIQFATGEMASAMRNLDILHSRIRLEPVHQLEGAFYQLAHVQGQWPSRLAFVRNLIEQGVQSKGWSFEITIERAEKDGHPNIPLLQALAAVVCDGADPKTLDVYPEWQAAKPQS
jgi:Tfp pilus assembly protein PilF